MHPQTLEQGVGKAGKDEPPLIGPSLGTGCAIGEQIQLLILDPVFHVTAGTILFVVEFEPVVVAGADHEAGVRTLGAVFQAGNHQAGLAPASGLVAKAEGGGQLVAVGFIIVTDFVHGGRRRGFQALIAGHAHNVIHLVAITPAAPEWPSCAGWSLG